MTEELHRRALETLPGGTHRRILQVIFDVYPEAVAAEAAADGVGMEPSGGGFRNPLGRLHTLGPVEYPERGLPLEDVWLSGEAPLLALLPRPDLPAPLRLGAARYASPRHCWGVP
jgi:hypothetical protein